VCPGQNLIHPVYFSHLKVAQSCRPIFLWEGLLAYFISIVNGGGLSPYSRLSHGRSLSRFFVSIVQVPARLNAQLGGDSMVAVVLGLDVVARMGRFRLGNASSETLASGRLRLVFGGIDSSAARGALLACFLGGIDSSAG
jgi:hypothetical protein